MKKLILTVFLLMCTVSLYAQRAVTGATYEKLFAAAQKYESEGRWFYAINAWYDCIEADLSSSNEAWKRYEKLKSRIEAGDETVWNGLEADARTYWSEHFSLVFTQTSHGIQKTDAAQGTVDYVVQYDISRTARYTELTEMMRKGRGKAAGSAGRNVYDCVLQLSVVHEDGTPLFMGTPQVAGGRYVFSGFPKQFVQLIASQKAYVKGAVVAERSADGVLARVPGGDQFCLLSRYRPEVAEREYVLTTTLAERLAGRKNTPVVAAVPAVSELPLVEAYVPVVPAVKPAQAEIFEEPAVAVMATAEEVVPVEPVPEPEEPVVEELPAEMVEAVLEEEQPAAAESAAESNDEPSDDEFENDSPVVQVMKQAEKSMKKKLDETPERTIQMMYLGISHDMRPQIGTYVSAPVLGNIFIGLNAGVGMKNLTFSYDALARIGVQQPFGKILTVGAFGIAGVYGYPVSGVRSGMPPVTIGAGVTTEVVLLRMATGVSAWAGYSLDGKLATNVSIGFGWVLDK